MPPPVSLLDLLQRREEGLISRDRAKRSVIHAKINSAKRTRLTLRSFLQRNNIFQWVFLGFSNCGAYAFILDDSAQAILLFPLSLEIWGVSLSSDPQPEWRFVQTDISYPVLENNLEIFSCRSSNERDAPNFVVTLLFPGTYTTGGNHHGQLDDSLLSYCELRCMYGGGGGTFRYNSSSSKSLNALYSLSLCLGVASHGKHERANLLLLNQLHKIKYFFVSDNSSCLRMIQSYSELHTLVNYKHREGEMFLSPLGHNVFGNRWYKAEPMSENSDVLEITFDAENFLKEYLRRYKPSCSMSAVREYEVRCAGLCDKHLDLLHVISLAIHQPSATDPHAVIYSALLYSFSPFYGVVIALKFCDLPAFCVTNKGEFTTFKACCTDRRKGFLTSATDFYVHMLRKKGSCEHIQADVTFISKVHDFSVNEILHPVLPVTIYNDEYGQQDGGDDEYDYEYEY